MPSHKRTLCESGNPAKVFYIKVRPVGNNIRTIRQRYRSSMEDGHCVRTYSPIEGIREVPSNSGSVGSALERDWCLVISAHMNWVWLSMREMNARSQSILCTPCWTRALRVMSLLGTGSEGGPSGIWNGNDAAERYLGLFVSNEKRVS